MTPREVQVWVSHAFVGHEVKPSMSSDTRAPFRAVPKSTRQSQEAKGTSRPRSRDLPSGWQLASREETRQQVARTPLFARFRVADTPDCLSSLSTVPLAYDLRPRRHLATKDESTSGALRSAPVLCPFGSDSARCPLDVERATTRLALE